MIAIHQGNRRQFFHHSLWEDARAGMYALPCECDDPLNVSQATMLLSCPQFFFRVAMTMLDEWPISAAANLSNRNRNRQAWVGQASCCFAFGAPEHQTKEAWHQLAVEQQKEANRTADEVISAWENARCRRRN